MRENGSSRSNLEARLNRFALPVVAGGVALGFIADYVDSRVLGFVAFGIAAVGLVAGAASFVWGFIQFPREIRQILAAAPWRHLSAVEPGTGRPWIVRMICLAGFIVAGGLLLARLLSTTVPAWQELTQRLGWTPDPGSMFVVFGAALALAGYWRMRRWGVWLMGLVVGVAPVVLFLVGSPEVAWGNLFGPVVFLVIGVRYYRRMA